METPTNTMDVDPSVDPAEIPTLDTFARNYCVATFGREPDGGYFLDVSCDLSTPSGRREFAKRADITPIIDAIAERMTDWHSSLHTGGHVDISGPLVYACGAAADKTAALLFRDVAPLLAYSVPWVLFAKTAHTVAAAAGGDREAQERIRTIKGLAMSGHAAAQNVAKTIDKIQRFVVTSGVQIVGHDPSVIDSDSIRQDELDVGSPLEVRGVERFGRRGDQMDPEIGNALKIPYRDPLTAIADGNPGAGLTFRALYSRGARTKIRKAA